MRGRQKTTLLSCCSHVAADPATGCWNWTSTLINSGYGRVCVSGRHTLAHRWVYEQVRGPIPDGLQLDHLCRNRACVNPFHLEAVTCAENIRRGERCKLAPESADAIRRLHAAGHSKSSLGRQYGVTRQAIQQVVSGRVWR